MKRILSVMLSLIMVVTMIPTFVVSAFADDEPSFVGPNDSDHAYLDIHSNGEDYTFYFMGSMGDAKIEGACYDLATNTLTLDNYNEPSTIIEASEMGSDFKISVNGENHIKAINVFADKYMGSLTIVGEGSISINENRDYDDVPLFLDANKTESILTVEDAVQLSVCANDEDVAIKVLNSNVEDSIVCANAEYRISNYRESSSLNRWVSAHDTQMNTFWAVKDSPCYATLCWDEFAGRNEYYEFVLVNKTVDGEEIVFADPTMDDMGNPNIIPSENIDMGNSVIACQIMDNYERQAVQKADDETEYALTEYTLEQDGVTEGPFWDVYKVIHDEDLGPFFYLVSEKLTEKPAEYTPVVEEINNNFKYIEGDFANFENEEPSGSDICFSANVRGSAITYHNGDNLYIEEGKTELISFTLLDENDVPYVPAWYSIDMAEQGFEIAPEPVEIDDIYYASITNNAKIENSGTLIINAFSGEKFADSEFDFVTTEPDAAFTLNIVSTKAFVGTATINQTDKYYEGDTIRLKQGESYTLYYDVENYPGFAIHGYDPNVMLDAGFESEQLFDENEWPYSVINTGTAEVGTKIVVPFHIYRIEDLLQSGWDFETTPKLYVYNITFEVAGNNTPCEHNYTSTVTKKPTCSEFGEKTYTCSKCGDTFVINKDNFTDYDQKEWTGVFPLGHTAYKDISETKILTEPTCSAPGKLTWKCERCGIDQYDMIVKNPNNHNYKTTTTKATTSADGKIVKKCADCGKTSTTKIKKVSTIKLSATKYTYDGKVKSPTLTVKNSAGKTLVKGTDYTVTTPTGRKNVGKYTYKITFKGNYSGTKSLSFTIVPKTTSISSLTAASKGFTVKWKKQATQTTGYQIQIATDSAFTKGVKSYTVTKNTTVSKKITKLTGKKKYYVRIRTYKTVSGTKYYSSWSAKKYVTTKK